MKIRLPVLLIVLASFLSGCAAVEAYRIWTADPSDGYAIGAAREIPKPYRNLE